ncbi:MAG: ROK family protein [Bacteroidota bacterium]|nr:ROK family protein [Bacteroidota bacterium]
MIDIAVGIDIGGTNTTFGFVDKKGDSLKKVTITTDSKQGKKEYATQLAEVVKDVLKENTEFSLLGIGIGAPNGNYYNGTIEFAPNLDFEGIVPLVDLMKEHFDVPIILTNDANAAAIGEMMYGGAIGMKNFIMITLGTGVGSGIVVNGEMVYGNDGFAGELGHSVAVANGRQCNCGRKGCLETYCSATGMVRTAFELMSTFNIPSALKNYSFNNLDSKIIFEEAEKGDLLAKEVFSKTGEILGRFLSDAVNFSSPEAFFLFGGPVAAGNVLLHPVKKHFENNILKIYKNKIKILPSELPLGDAAILGASALVWKELE